MSQTRKSNSRNSNSRKSNSRKSLRHRKSQRRGGSKWTAFVKKIYAEMKRKNKDVKLGDAMKEASRRKSEM